MSKRKCETCQGTGKVHSHNDRCWDCRGRGHLLDEATDDPGGYCDICGSIEHTRTSHTPAPLPDDVRAAVERLRPFVDDPDFHRYAKVTHLIPDIETILTHLQEKP